MRFEAAAPVRAFASYRRQRNLPGRWWSATKGGHVGYESWLERDQVMLLDFDPAVVGIASQPFWLFWSAANGRPLSHAPDYFARHEDGTAVVIDCRPAERRRPRDWAKFEATEAACTEVGWGFRLLGAPDPVVVRNVRWLAGYRHPRHRVEPVASELLAVFAEPLPLMDGAAAGGESLAVLNGAVPSTLVARAVGGRLGAPARWFARLAGEGAVMAGAGSVLRPGDWVTFNGDEHQVVALAGTAVRLRSAGGAESVVLASYLMAAPDFVVTGAEPLPEMEPSGLLETLPEPTRAAAERWQRHVVEVDTGLLPGAEPGTPPREEYDPATRSLTERMQAKAAELGVSLRTVEGKRSRYVKQGLWGLVDQRATRRWEATGRADARLVAAVREGLDGETHLSTGTRSRLIRRVIKTVEATYADGAVPLPSERTLYKLIDALSTGRHTFGAAEARGLMLPRTLPDPVPPARHEIPPSYISRLATLLGLDIDGLWFQVTQPAYPGAGRRVVVPERLAALTGRSVHALAGAMPELRDPPPDWEMFRHQPQTGCHLCDARHPGGKVVRLLPHHAYICLRHGAWIGPPDIDHLAVDLAPFPEIVDAQRRHLLLLRRYGWAPTYDAVLTALMICAHIWYGDGRPLTDVFGVWNIWDDRVHHLIPLDPEKQDYIAYSASKLFAAVYPEAVTLAPLIASPYWRRLADGTGAEQARFFAEVGKRVTYPYNEPDRGGDAVAHWALADSWRPPSRPLTTYAPGRDRGTLPGLAANRLARQEKSAKWFSRSRRNQGRTLLFHGHLKPVLLRDREPRYVKWEGTIWHSGRTDDLMKEEVARRRKELQAGAAHVRYQRAEDRASSR
ncbi:TnsA-like heteromeric transposase endonuclease subunit [Streptomyces sp. NBRC 110611]|uniref:TnsA-like heteromeric transposase endonuclease subunit n=1 Tax=Streptomyces sp. NBRC 110611 TaxID=1621259 RepID=UPI00215BD75B|nr:TnsA-like heteromeric transposase endonuclease subunit [Streptomyces sp. NBRC 110611]